MSKNKKSFPVPCLKNEGSWVDTHCHLDMYAEEPGQIIADAADVGVSTIITVGIDLASSQKAIEIAARHSNVHASVGVHPHHAGDLNEKVYAEMQRLALSPKVVAYGEIGLDYVKDYAPIPVQLEHFRLQVRLAKELDLPLIIHDREAHEDILAILTEEGPYPAGGVLHCFSGDRRFAERVLALDFFISIPGVVTFTKAETMHNAVAAVPLSSLLLETDGPFLAPVPKRGKINMPSYLPYTALKVAELKNVRLEELAARTSENARKLFRLP